MDFSNAKFNGDVPDPKSFLGGISMLNNQFIIK